MRRLSLTLSSKSIASPPRSSTSSHSDHSMRVMDDQLNTRDTEAAAEDEPLLTSETETPSKKPLPIVQILVICFARIAEPIAYTQNMPYRNQMIEELLKNGKPEDVGFYSGLLDSLSSLAQFVMIYYWSSLSDRIGRKPVVMIGLGGVAVASLVLGFSSNVWQLLLSRALAGSLTANVAIVPTILSDITDKSNESFVFPLSSAAYYVGCIIGPLIGGLLANPVERYPNVFGSNSRFKKWPYLLPSLTAFVINMAAVLAVAFFLKESLPNKPSSHSRESTTTSRTAERDDEDGESSLPAHPSTPDRSKTMRLLANRRFLTILICGFFLSIGSLASNSVYILWAYTPTSLGGLGRTSKEIGYSLSGAGILGVLTNVVAFPILHRRFDTIPLFIGCMALYPVFYVVVPIIGALVRVSITDSDALGGFWVAVALVLVIRRMAALAFPANYMMVKAVASDPTELGSMFGLLQIVAAVGETVGPAFASSMFALSVKQNVLGGNLVWLVMICVSLVGFGVALRGKR